MGTIGNKPEYGVYGRTRTQAESFNGDGNTTSFTLGHYVKNATDIEVLVDNVQQSPFDGSYSVNGTTLTFSGTPSSGTNNIYVIYRQVGTTIDTQSLIPDDNSVTTSKLGTITSMTVDRSITAGQAGDSSENYAALIVNSSGVNPSQAAIAIQQGTNEGDTIIFGDYEPYVEWGINTDNGANTINFTSGTSTGAIANATRTLMNRSGAARTAYVKQRMTLTDGNFEVGGNAYVYGSMYGSFHPADDYTTFTLTGSGASTSINFSNSPNEEAWLSLMVFVSSTDTDQSDHLVVTFGPQTYSSRTYWGDTYPGSQLTDGGFAPVVNLGDSQDVAAGHYGTWAHIVCKQNSSGNLYAQIEGTNAGCGVAVKLQGWWFAS